MRRVANLLNIGVENGAEGQTEQFGPEPEGETHMSKRYTAEAPGALAEAEAKWLKAEKGVEITAAQVRAVISYHGEFQKSDARKAQREAEAAERKAEREAREQAKAAQEAERAKKVAERVAAAKARAEAAKLRAEKAAEHALALEKAAAEAGKTQQPAKPAKATTTAKPAAKAANA